MLRRALAIEARPPLGTLPITGGRRTPPHIGNLTKEWDSTASVKLFEQAIAGKLNLKALLTFTTTSEGSVEKYLEIELTDVGISNFQINGSGDDKPSESLSLNFAKIQYKPYVVGADKIVKTGKIVSYDLTQMKANA